MKNNLTYKKAFEELEEIIADIESGDAPIDSLLQKIKRANELMDFCKTRLKNTEEEINKLLAKKSK